jgi:hypothetical protein
MKKVLVAALVAVLAALASVLPAAGASAADAAQARGAQNTWMTKSIRARIMRAGSEGVAVRTVHRWARAQGKAPPEEQPESACATSDPAEGEVYAGACQIYPYECTANFIYKRGFVEQAATESDGRTYFLGTAGHCVDHSNQPVFIENNAAIIFVGRVDKHMNGGIGNDFASVQIEQGRTIDPSPPAIGGPEGIYAGCERTGIKFWGHGAVVAVAQGQPGAGLAHLWFDRSFAWAGDGLPGDSGSAVITDDNEAGGILTHLNVDPQKYPGGTHAGTRVTRALTFLGGTYYLVNEDFTLSRATMADTQCGNANSGNGGGSASLVSSILG